MSNPFMNTLTSGSSANIKVNNTSPNNFGKISVPLTSLPDVVIDTDAVSNGEVLTYDTTSSKWKNQNPLSSIHLSSLSDCAISNPSDSSSLIYSSYLSKWINTPNQIITMDFILYVRQVDFTGGAGTCVSTSFYSWNSAYASFVVDASFVNQTSSFFIKLPTDLSNGSIIYFQIATVG